MIVLIIHMALIEHIIGYEVKGNLRYLLMVQALNNYYVNF